MIDKRKIFRRQYLYDCPGCGYVHAFALKSEGGNHNFNMNLGEPTVEPSLMQNFAPGRKCHSFIRGGNIQFLGDCWHKLAGKTVPLPTIKLDRVEEFTVAEVWHMPRLKAHGVLYISREFNLAIHLCACGCGVETVTPLNEWRITEQNGGVTLRPSIGNFKGEKPYHAHYYVTNSKVEWL